jgi:pyruvate-formate lyase
MQRLFQTLVNSMQVLHIQVLHIHVCAVCMYSADQRHEMQHLPLCMQQQDEAIERERAAAAARLCDASERWEAQLQASRMRLIADYDMKVRPYPHWRSSRWCWFAPHAAHRCSAAAGRSGLEGLHLHW